MPYVLIFLPMEIIFPVLSFLLFLLSIAKESSFYTQFRSWPFMIGSLKVPFQLLTS